MSQPALLPLAGELKPPLPSPCAATKCPTGNGSFRYLRGLSSIFMYDRRLLAKLSQCAWKVLSLYLKQGVL